MRRFLLPLLLLLLFGACNGAELPLNPTATPPSVATPTQIPTPTPILPGAQGGLERILQRGALIVGIQESAAPPFVSQAGDGSLEGLDVLLADAFARRWLGRPNTLAWNRDANINDLIEGRIDLLMGGLPHTRAAEAEIDFSQTYWQQGEIPIAIGLPANDSLLRDLVNATLQTFVDEGVWADLVQVSGASQTYTPARWIGSIPSMDFLAASSESPAPSRLDPNRALTFAYQSVPGFVSTGDDNAGYLPDLARELNRRLTGNGEAQLEPLATAPTLSFVSFDLYLGPQLHEWSLEHRADFSQDFYGDGLALIARPGSKVERIEQLDRRPTALVASENSRQLYEQAIAAAGVEPILFAVDDADAAVTLLADNKVDAVLIQGYPAARLIAARVPEAILTPGRHGPIQPFVIALPSNDSALRDAVNLALQDMLGDGTLAQLHSRYFGGDPPLLIESWPIR